MRWSWPSIWLFHRTICRTWWNAPLGPLLVVLSVGLALSCFIAISNASRSSIAAFSQQALSIGGGDALELRDTRGEIPLAEASAFLEPLSREFEVTPVVERRFILGDGREVRFLAVDGAVSSGGAPVSLPTGARVALSSDLFAQLESGGLRGAIDSTPVTIGREEVAAAPLPYGTIVTDIGTAHTLLPTLDSLSAVVLRPRGGDVSATVPAVLNDRGWILSRAGSSSQQVGELLKAFRLNIGIMVLMTVLVSALVVMNGVELHVFSRRREIAILRTLGAPFVTVGAMTLYESLLLAAFGAIAATTLGAPVTRILGQEFLGTASQLFLEGRELPYLSLLDSRSGAISLIAITIILAGLSAVVPLRSVAKIAPGAQSLAGGGSNRVRMSGWVTGALLALIVTVSQILLARSLSILASGYLAALGIIAVLLLGVAPLFRVLSSITRTRGGVSALVAASLIRAQERGVVLAGGVNAAAIALLVGLGVMVTSFRESLIDWSASAVRADISVRAPLQGSSGISPTLSPQTVRDILALPAIASSVQVSHDRAEVNGKSFEWIGTAVHQLIGEGSYQIVRGSCSADELLSGGSVLLSEAAARKLGDPARLSLRGREYSVCAVYRDFASQEGAILMESAPFARASGMKGIFSVALFLREGADLDATMREVVRIAGPHALALSRAELKRTILTTFDETFRITTFIRILIVFIALGASVMTVLQLLIERAPEIRLLGILGGERSTVRRALVIGSGLVLGGSAGAGVLAGIALGWVLVTLINPLSFGWTLMFTVRPIDIALPTLAVVLANALLLAMVSLRGGGKERLDELAQKGGTHDDE